MRKILFIFPVAALLCLAACSNNTAEGNGKITSQNRDVKAFNKVQVSGAMNVLVATGKTQKVMVTTDSNLISDIETKVSGDTLYIQPKNGISLKSGNMPVVTLRAKELEEIDTSGAIKLHITNLMAKDFKVKSSGSSDINLRGEVKSLDIDTSGSANVNAVQLKTDDANIAISGSGNIKVHAVKKLDIKISGSGSVSYSGDPEIHQTITGSGKILKLERK